MSELNILFGENKIKRRVKELAGLIIKDIKKDFIALCILKGSVIFYTDLIREISRQNGPNMICEFIKASSYSGIKSTGNVDFSINFNVSGKNILIIEDIIDTGLTMGRIKNDLINKGAKTVKVCTFLDKPSRRKIDFDIDFIGYEVPDKFVVGYGLDFNQKYRELPYIAELK